MKATKCFLMCFTRWGGRCHAQYYNSISEAMRAKRDIVDNDFAFSYIIFSEDKKHILKRG